MLSSCSQPSAWPARAQCCRPQHCLSVSIIISHHAKRRVNCVRRSTTLFMYPCKRLTGRHITRRPSADPSHLSRVASLSVCPSDQPAGHHRGAIRAAKLIEHVSPTVYCGRRGLASGTTCSLPPLLGVFDRTLFKTISLRRELTIKYDN